MRRVTPRRVAQALARRRKRAGILAARRDGLRPSYAFGAHRRGRVNVTVVLHDAAKPTSSTFIRLYGPLSLPSFGRRVGLDIVDEKGMWISPRTTVCIVQRTAFSREATARSFVAEARRRGCVLVVDSDDAFSALDPDHPQHDRQVERAAVLEGVMREADEVWFSTEELAAAHDLPAARVVRNTLDLGLWAPPAHEDVEIRGDAPLRILYMGTHTHDGDFAMVEPVLERLHASHPGQFSIVMVGVARGLSERPWMTVLEPTARQYPAFVPWLAAQGPFEVGISPLVDSAFNRSKSDIKCLDYLALGATPVVSDVTPYRVDELDDLVVRVPNDDASWYAALVALVETRADRRGSAVERRAAGRAYIAASRSADRTATVLRQRVDALSASSPSRAHLPPAAPSERHHP